MHAADRPREPTAASTIPGDLKLHRESRTLTVTWQDGHVSIFDLPTLRKACPCATCNTERQQQSGRQELFPILNTSPGPPRPVTARLVGSYAIQIIWPDGHDTGIYDFRYPRSLDSTAP